MRALITLLFSVICLFSCCSCKGQESLTMRYVGHRYKETKNKSFINDELIFLKGKDSLFINVKLPFDLNNHQIVDRGIFYNCHLKKDTTYTLTLKKICVKDISDVPNSYYMTNAIFNKKDCSKFTEIKRNTKYKYEGNYGKYVDMNGGLYEIIRLSPSDGCFFQN